MEPGSFPTSVSSASKPQSSRINAEVPTRGKTTRAERLQYLEDDPDAKSFDEYKVICAVCPDHRIIRLEKRVDYSLGHWLQHKEKLHPSSDYHSTSAGYSQADSRSARMRLLTNHPNAGKVERHRVFCRKCDQWVRLRRQSSYALFTWERHCRSCTGTNTWPLVDGDEQDSGELGTDEQSRQDSPHNTHESTMPTEPPHSGRQTPNPGIPSSQTAAATVPIPAFPQLVAPLPQRPRKKSLQLYSPSLSSPSESPIFVLPSPAPLDVNDTGPIAPLLTPSQISDTTPRGDDHGGHNVLTDDIGRLGILPSDLSPLSSAPHSGPPPPYSFEYDERAIDYTYNPALSSPLPLPPISALDTFMRTGTNDAAAVLIHLKEADDDGYLPLWSDGDYTPSRQHTPSIGLGTRRSYTLSADYQIIRDWDGSGYYY